MGDERSEGLTELEAGLADALANVLGAPVEITGLGKLSGGASRETWAFTANGDDFILRPFLGFSFARGIRANGQFVIRYRQDSANMVVRGREGELVQDFAVCRRRHAEFWESHVAEYGGHRDQA